MNTEKIDLYRELKNEYVKPKKPTLIETTPASYLAAEGRGEPGGELFQSRIGALYGIAYTIKFQSKGAGRDFKVCPLEGMWWGARKKRGAPESFQSEPQESWRWKLLIRVPDFVTDNDVKEAANTLIEKGKPADVRDVTLERVDEGRCVQMLHVGPYENEPESIAVMLAFLEDEGLKPDGVHHEIYLSDPRRVPPERLKTILRFPV